MLKYGFLLVGVALAVAGCSQATWHSRIGVDPVALRRGEIVADDQVFRGEPPFTREEAFARLMNARSFYPVEYGMDGGAISKQVAAVKTLAWGEDAREVFLDLIRRAENGGKLYALCGLYRADRRAFEKAVGRFVSDGSMVRFCGGGCVTDGVVMREVVCSSTGELDVMHGGYPRSVFRLADLYEEGRKY